MYLIRQPGSIKSWECLRALEQLAKSNKVALVWVLGIIGNKVADCLAKERAETPFYGPKPFCGISKSRLRAAINERKVEKIYNTLA